MLLDQNQDSPPPILGTYKIFPGRGLLHDPMKEYVRKMKEYVGNMKEYVKNMKKYMPPLHFSFIFLSY